MRGVLSFGALAALVACGSIPAEDTAPDSAPDSGADSAPDSGADSTGDTAGDGALQMDEEDVPDGWALSLTAWDHTDLSWCVADAGDVELETLRGAMEVATATWAAAPGSGWTFYETTCGGADFVVEVTDVDGRGNIAGLVSVEDTVRIRLDDAEDWTDAVCEDGSQPVDVVTVLLHEVGHVIGLGHVNAATSDPASVMMSAYTGSRRTLTEDDVALLGTSSAGPQPSLTVEVWVWAGTADGDEATCPGDGERPCSDYELAEVLSIGEAVTVAQYQGWPVQLWYEAAEGVTIPSLGIDVGEPSGVVTFNPPRALDITLCVYGVCETTVSLTMRAEPTSALPCVDHPLTGMQTAAPDWWMSQGESYGVGAHTDPMCTNPSCTTEVPRPACVDGNPNTADPACAAFGCQCNLSDGSGTGWEGGGSDLRYSVAAQDGVRAPWFADRWETGGMFLGTGAGSLVRIGAEVRVSGQGVIYRPVVDVRSNWGGQWSEFATDPPNLRPDGVEGPPVFDNAVNRYLLGDGALRVTFTFAPASYASDLWLQPIWNVIVLDDGDEGVSFRDVWYSVCGEDVGVYACDASIGCSVSGDVGGDRDSDGIVDGLDLLHATGTSLCIARSTFSATDPGRFAVVGDYGSAGSWEWSDAHLATESADELCHSFPAGDYRVGFLSEGGDWADVGDFCWYEDDLFCSWDATSVSFSFGFSSDGYDLTPIAGDE